MNKRTKVYIHSGDEWNVQETVEWLKPVSLPRMHSVGVTQQFERDGEIIVASKLVGQNFWIYDNVVRS